MPSRSRVGGSPAPPEEPEGVLPHDRAVDAGGPRHTVHTALVQDRRDESLATDRLVHCGFRIVREQDDSGAMVADAPALVCWGEVGSGLEVT